MFTHRGCIARKAATVLLALTVSTAFAGEYAIVEIGTLGGTHGDAYDINSHGQVVGRAANVDNVTRPFSWTETGGIEDLGTLAGGSNTIGQCYGINDLGWAVGTSENVDGVWNATLWRPGQLPLDLGDLDGFTQSFAVAVNSDGQVVGEARRSVGGAWEQRAFLWTQTGGMVDLGSLGGTETGANDINELGQIVGSSALSGGASHAFSCTGPSDMSDIYSAYPDRDYTAGGINAVGAIVGQAEKADGSKVPALWADGDGIPVLADAAYGWAEDINDQGTLVGRYRLLSYADPNIPFVWNGDGPLVPLPFFEEDGSYTVEAINNDGWIAGCGTVGEHEVPLVWIPDEELIPVPGDANGDREVDLCDLGILATNWRRTDAAGVPEGDFTGDHFVGLDDLGILATHWGTGVEAIPEPATMTMLGLGGLTLLRRGRAGCGRC